MAPTASFSIEINGLEVHFENSSTGGEQYKWDFGDGTFSELMDPEHVYSAPGSYVVKLLVENDCGLDTYVDTILVLTSGINPLPSDWTSVLFPNPNNGQFQFSLQLEEELSISILNVLGEVLYTPSELKGALPYVRVDLPSGVYVLLWRSGGMVGQVRFAVQ
jgi:hypothetical protein